MKTLCIVPCGSKKIWDKNPIAGPSRSKDVYIGPFARKCREYAETFYPSSWCILSAKFGFLFPNDIVPGAYNVSFTDKSSNPINVHELKSQAKEKSLNQHHSIVALGGKTYVSIVRQVFPNKKILNPLSGCKGIGYMLGALGKALDTHTPLKEEKRRRHEEKN